MPKINKSFIEKMNIIPNIERKRGTKQPKNLENSSFFVQKKLATRFVERERSRGNKMGIEDCQQKIKDLVEEANHTVFET